MSFSNTASLLISAMAITTVLVHASFASAQKKRAFTVEDLYKVGRVSQLEVSATRDLAAFAVKTFDMDTNKSISHLWIADLKAGTTRQLTGSNKSDWAPRWMPDGRLAFLSVRSGSPQIWAIYVDGGEASQLTNLPLDIENFAVGPDGDHVAEVMSVYPECDSMSCNAERAKSVADDKVKARIYDKLLYRIWDHWRDETLGHVFWVPLDGGEPRDLTPGKFQTPPLDLGGNMDLSISPDGTEVAFTANTTENPAWNTNNDIFAVSVSGGEPRNLTATYEGTDAEPIYSPDGNYIAHLTMKRPGFEADRKMLVLYDRKSKKRVPLTDSLDRSIYSYSWAPNSKLIVFYGADRGRVAIWKVSVPSGIVTKLIADGTNKGPRVTRDSQGLVFLKETMSTPTEVFTATTKGGSAIQLSHINDDLLADIEMGASEDIEYKGANGDQVHGFLLKPPGFDSKQKYPLLMLIHGGPQGAFGDGFHPRWNMQMFATPGFVVAAVNFHGSKGYGQDFCDSISGDWGGKPYEDIMKGVDHVSGKYSFVDGGNVSAAGASYGGFMINWILGHTDRFKSLVSHDGVYELVSMYGSTEELWFPEWEFKGTPWDAPALYQEYNPASHAKSFKTPTLVIHGEHDYRVPYTQGMQLFTALQRQGVESKFLFYPDENHFVQKPQNARLWWNTVLGWLADHAGVKWSPPNLKPNRRNKEAG